MTRKGWRMAGVLAGGAVVVGLAIFGRTVAFHLGPPRWTGEAGRLAEALRLSSGDSVADIGAGDGDMAVEMTRRVGANGLVFATELTEKQRSDISAAARRARASRLRVLAALERSTGLPDACCDAIYMRNVLHHVSARDEYAKDLFRSLKPGGRLAIIDFEPGGFLHLGGRHGITPDEVVTLMSGAGFRLERRIEHWGGGLFAVVFIKV